MHQEAAACAYEGGCPWSHALMPTMATGGREAIMGIAGLQGHDKTDDFDLSVLSKGWKSSPAAHLEALPGSTLQLEARLASEGLMSSCSWRPATEGINATTPLRDPTAAATAWWRIVWCHERCHKQENQVRCQGLRGSVNETGALLVCLKKAVQFALWVRRSPRPPFVLVTDWREAQPCMQCLGTSPEVSKPFLAVVLCESQRQYSKASDWARSLPAEVGPICVCERADIPAELLSGIIRRHFSPSSDGPERALEAGADRRAANREHTSSAASIAAPKMRAPAATSSPEGLSEYSELDVAGGQDVAHESAEEETRDLRGCMQSVQLGNAPAALRGRLDGHGSRSKPCLQPPAAAKRIPAPVKLFREPDGVLAIRECSGAMPGFFESNFPAA